MALEEIMICNGTVAIDINDFFLISMGCGIGYFITGYLIINSIYKQCKKRNNTEVITAVQV